MSKTAIFVDSNFFNGISSFVQNTNKKEGNMERYESPKLGMVDFYLYHSMQDVLSSTKKYSKGLFLFLNKDLQENLENYFALVESNLTFETFPMVLKPSNQESEFISKIENISKELNAQRNSEPKETNIWFYITCILFVMVIALVLRHPPESKDSLNALNFQIENQKKEITLKSQQLQEVLQNLETQKNDVERIKTLKNIKINDLETENNKLSSENAIQVIKLRNLNRELSQLKIDFEGEKGKTEILEGKLKGVEDKLLKCENDLSSLTSSTNTIIEDWKFKFKNMETGFKMCQSKKKILENSIEIEKNK
jgi:cell division protein FtsB